MGLDYLSKSTRTVIAHNVYSTGGTTVGNLIDMSGYDGLMLTHITGNTTSNVTMTALGSATTTAGDFQAIASASVASTAANRMLAIDLLRPGFRYIKPSVASTGTANAGAVLGILYHPHVKPTTNSSDLLECDQILHATT